MIEPIENFTGKIHCEDCLETMARMPDKSVDLVLTDPPYGINYNPNGGNGVTKRGTYKRIIGDNKPFDPSFLLCFPNIILWGANHYANKLPASSGWLVWNKIGEGKSSDCSDVELAWTNKKMPARRFNYLWRGMIRQGKREKRIHPTQKPIALMRWCLSLFPNCNTVLDPFLGSGTTAIACKELGRKYIGIEISPEYCKIAENRLKNTMESLL